MEYFRLMQDRRYGGEVHFDVFSLFRHPKDNKASNFHHLAPMTMRKVRTTEFSFFPDVMDMQMYIISDAMNDILSLFLKDVDYRILCILNSEKKFYIYYYAYMFATLDCFSAKSETNIDRSKISKLVLKKDMIQGRDIFKLGGVNCHALVVSLPVAEAILRRNFKGIKIVKTEFE